MGGWWRGAYLCAACQATGAEAIRRPGYRLVASRTTAAPSRAAPAAMSATCQVATPVLITLTIGAVAGAAGVIPVSPGGGTIIAKAGALRPRLSRTAVAAAANPRIRRKRRGAEAFMVFSCPLRRRAAGRGH